MNTEPDHDNTNEPNNNTNRIVPQLTHDERHALTTLTPATPRQLHQWLRFVLDINIPTEPLLPNHAAPFDYIKHTFFEAPHINHTTDNTDNQPRPPADCVVWANRGGGKTFLGALATALDLIFKPTIEVRILAGSLEQARRMHDHLRKLFDHPATAPLLASPITDRRIRLRSGSRAELLAQSEASVRGTRVQKLRCDEVELFDPDVWQAAQLTTISANIQGPWGNTVRGAVEALSTMHRPHGLMHQIIQQSIQSTQHTSHHQHQHQHKHTTPTPRELVPWVEQPSTVNHLHPLRTSNNPQHSNPISPYGNVPFDNANQSPRAVFRWGLIDVLERCPPSRSCESCTLYNDCRGLAKHRSPHAPGHLSIDDAIRMKSRVAQQTWESEMLCLRPSRRDAVLPEFDASLHIIDHDPPSSARDKLLWLAGMDFGFRAPTAIVIAAINDAGTIHILDEITATERTLEQNLAELNAKHWPAPAWIGIDPAGRQRNDQTGYSNAAAMRKAGIETRSRPMRLHPGLELLRARLKPADNSPPTLFIHKRCTNLIKAIEQYHYPPDKPESLEPVKDGADHHVDALRYLVTNLDKPYKTTLTHYY